MFSELRYVLLVALAIGASITGSAQAQCNPITVSSQQTVTIDTAVCAEYVSIASDGELVIAAGGTLTITGSGTSTISSGGVLRLESSTSVLKIDASQHTFTGAGAIVGENDAAKIQIVEPSTGVRVLVVRLEIRGMMMIEPVIVSGSGQSQLLVQNISTTSRAKLIAEGGTLALSPDLLFDDGIVSPATVGPLYSSNGGLLVLAWLNDGSGGDHPILVGDFSVTHCGEIHFAADVNTTGTFNSADGSITFSNDACFRWNYGSMNQVTVCEDTTYGDC